MKLKQKQKNPKKTNPSLMSVNEFLSGGFSNIDDNSSTDGSEINCSLKESTTEKKQKQQKSSHKEDLKKLQTVDPEFYKFLKENDQDLLNFDDSDDNSDDDDDIKNEKIHKLPEKLEVASDESDFEDDEQSSKGGVQSVTLKMISKWNEDLSKDNSGKILREIIDAFEAAVQRVASPDEQNSLCRYRVEGSAIFNGVVRLLVVELQSAVRLVLKLPSGSKERPHKCKAWKKIKHSLVKYFKALSQLCMVTSPSMLTVLLKHLHQMIPFLSEFPTESNRFINRLVKLWTSESDVVRVLAFLCLLRLANYRKDQLPTILKKMYMTFVQNSKFVSPSNLAGLHFLRQSLSEMFALNPALSYQHAFFYIRQLSIHLRNAVTLKKKESFQSVYNWQFIQSLSLWSDLMGLISSDTQLYALLYPLVQITIGTIKLIPSAQYYPLRFHCIRILLNLMSKCGVYVPVFPFLVEILKEFDWNRKHAKSSMKPLDLRCVLRCSKSQMQESGFKDAILELTCALLLEAFTVESYRVSFPDVVVPAVIQMKQFLKTCKVSNYCKQVKVILDKVLENAKSIESQRAKLGSSLKLNNSKAIGMFEAQLRASDSLPLQVYYTSWKKLNTLQMNKRYSNNEQIGDYKLPTVNKSSKKRLREKDENGGGPPELFPSDDEDEELAIEKVIGGEPEHPPKKKKKKTTPNPKPKPIVLEKEFIVDDKDLVQDLNLSDLD